jgi:indolepyruvate ferredoxin oxidoreductase beta subunit
MNTQNILLAGVGGQGTVLASKILARCAITRGFPAHTAETIGMAQRGGSVVSHVRIGDGAYSPLIPKGTADLILGFEPAEAVRCVDYLRVGGTIVVSDMPVKSAAGTLSAIPYNAADMLEFLRGLEKSGRVGRVVTVDAEAIARKTSYRSLNIALLGAALLCGALNFTADDVKSAIEASVAPKYIEQNLIALTLGANTVIGDMI